MKKRILILIGLVIVIISIIALRFFYNNNYEYAKGESIKFLNSNINDLQDNANEMILDKSKESKNYKKISYRYYKDSDDKEYIQFDINAQGMLGGQYWGIIYCPDDNLLNGNSIEIYDENKETGKGNNIFIKEKIKDKWYFYYDDYDGKVDITSIN